MYRTSAYTKGSARTHRLSYLYQSPNLYLTRTYSNNSPDPTAPFLEMASIVDRVYAARGVRYVQQKHITDILFTLSSLGFNIHAKREGAVLRHINVDSLPCLDAPARELLKYVATGEPWREVEKQRRQERERYEEWLRSWLSMIPCLTLSEDEPGSGQHAQGEAGRAVATATGDHARGSSAVLAVPSQQQPLCRRRAHQEGTQEVPAGAPKGAE